MSHDDTAGDVTRLLHAVQGGDRDAFDRLLPLVYDELRRIARRQLHRERPGHTLFPTALVHEAYVKLVERPPEIDWAGRKHFLAVAARAMRQVLVDHARRKSAEKRGGDLARTTLNGDRLGFELALDDMLALDAALDRLDRRDPRLRQVVEYRFFAGMGEDEIAELLAVSTRTVQRDWLKARAWLYKELYPRQAPAGAEA